MSIPPSSNQTKRKHQSQNQNQTQQNNTTSSPATSSQSPHSSYSSLNAKPNASIAQVQPDPRQTNRQAVKQTPSQELLQKPKQKEQQQQHQQPSPSPPQQQTIEAEEYDEATELQRKRLPKIYNLKSDKVLVAKNSKVEVYDIQMKASNSEEVLWTTLQITVNPFEQLRPFEADEKDGEKICYMVLKGRGEIMSSELRKKITEASIFFVEKGVRHNLNNLSEDEPLVLIAHYPGYLDARDIYKPITQKYKKAAESREKFFAGGSTQQINEPTTNKTQEPNVGGGGDPGQIVREMDRRYV